MLAQAALGAGLPEGAIASIESTDYDEVNELMGLHGYVDVLIPRGGAGLIKSVVENAKVPVIETGVGNCHVYIHSSADIEMAKRIVVNAKCQRPGVCNAAESLLVDEAIYEKALPPILKALEAEGVTIYGDEKTRALGAVLRIQSATEEDWGTEYLDMKISCKVVADARRGDPAHQHVRHAALRGDRDRGLRRGPALPQRGRRRGRLRQRVDALHRRGRVRARRRDRHLDAEAPRARSDGARRVDLDEVPRHGKRADQGVSGTRRLGIMGGTFDPVHYGHLVTAEEALAQFDLDEVVFMPTGQPQAKRHPTVASAHDRYLMTVIATAANQDFSVSSLEVDRPGPTYTVDTMRELGQANEGAEFYFITGADAVWEILHWKDAARARETHAVHRGHPTRLRPRAVLERDRRGGRRATGRVHGGPRARHQLDRHPGARGRGPASALPAAGSRRRVHPEDRPVP